MDNRVWDVFPSLDIRSTACRENILHVVCLIDMVMGNHAERPYHGSLRRRERKRGKGLNGGRAIIYHVHGSTITNLKKKEKHICK